MEAAGKASLVNAGPIMSKSSGEASDGRRAPPPLRLRAKDEFLRRVVDSPVKCSFLIILLPLIFSVVGMMRFELNDLQGWDVPASRGAKTWDAYLMAEEAYGELVGDDAPSVDERSVESSYGLEVYFEAENDVASLEPFLEEISFIVDETALKLSEVCLLDNSTACVKPYTISDSPPFPQGTALFSEDSSDDLKVVRAKFHMGLPLSGFNNPGSRAAEQKTLLRKKIEEVSVEYLFRIDSPAFNVLPYWDDLDEYSAFVQLPLDAAFAGGSFLTVGLLLFNHVRSVFVTLCGAGSILLSFPTAFFAYRVVFGMTHMGTLQVLAIYVLLGIGVDDIVVLFDAFQYSKMAVPRSDRSLRDWRIARLEWTYSHAMTAMSVTSATTFAAFAATASAPMTNISVFGIWAALLVAVNFCFVLTLLPCVLIIHERRDNFSGGDPTLSRVASFYKFKFGPFVVAFRNHILIVSFGVACVAAYFSSKLSPSSRAISDIWPESHPNTRTKRYRFTAFVPPGQAELYERWQVTIGYSEADRSGKSFFDPTDLGAFEWDARVPKFFDSQENALKVYTEICSKVAANAALADDDPAKLFRGLTCVYDSLDASLYAAPSSYDKASFVSNATAASSEVSKVWAHAGEILSMSFDVVSTTRDDASVDKRWRAVENTRKWIAENVALGGVDPLLIHWSTPWIRTSVELVKISMRGLGSGLALAFVVLVLATRDFRMSTLALGALCLIVLGVLATFEAMGWALGFMESISVTALVGLSIDYVVHVALAYLEPPPGTAREERTIYALERMGSSVLGGSTTTLGASAFLFFCTIAYLRLFGTFLFITVGYSATVAHFTFSALLAKFGPEAVGSREEYATHIFKSAMNLHPSEREVAA